MKRTVLGLLCGALVVALAGCGGGYDGPPYADVTGTVTLDDKPVPKANVYFITEGNEQAIGLTDDQGKFKLKFKRGDKSYDGAYVGLNKVSIDKYADAPGAGTDTDGTGGDPTKIGQTMQAGAGENMLPAKYSDPNTSELTADVKKDGENNFTFPLKSN